MYENKTKKPELGCGSNFRQLFYQRSNISLTQKIIIEQFNKNPFAELLFEKV
jgi:hypothetical protein